VWRIPHELRGWAAEQPTGAPPYVWKAVWESEHGTRPEPNEQREHWDHLCWQADRSDAITPHRLQHQQIVERLTANLNRSTCRMPGLRLRPSKQLELKRFPACRRSM
jgi:hypothetical protein